MHLEYEYKQSRYRPCPDGTHGIVEEADIKKIKPDIYNYKF